MQLPNLGQLEAMISEQVVPEKFQDFLRKEVAEIATATSERLERILKFRPESVFDITKEIKKDVDAWCERAGKRLIHN